MFLCYKYNITSTVTLYFKNPTTNIKKTLCAKCKATLFYGMLNIKRHCKKYILNRHDLHVIISKFLNISSIHRHSTLRATYKHHVIIARCHLFLQSSQKLNTYNFLHLNVFNHSSIILLP